MALPCRVAPFPVDIQQQHLQVISQIPRDIIQNRIQLIGRATPLAVLLAQDLTAIYRLRIVGLMARLLSTPFRPMLVESLGIRMTNWAREQSITVWLRRPTWA